MDKQLRRALIQGIGFAFVSCLSSPYLSSSVSAEDKFDVKGGHFNKDEVNKDLFAHPAAAPAPEPAPAEPPAKPVDSWAVDESSFKGAKKEELQRAVQEVQKTAPEPAAPFSPEPAPQDVPADLTRAAQAIEQLKTMLKTQGSAPNIASGVPNVIDQARGTRNTAPSQPNTYPAPKTPAPVTKAVTPRGPEPATLSVIVSAIPESHLIETMRRVTELKQAGAVKIGSISILGLDDVYNAAAQMEEENIDAPISDEEHKKLLDIQKRIAGNKFDDPKMFPDSLPPKPPALKLLDDMKLAPSGVLPLGPMFSKYQATSSPIWIVKDTGKDHIFEGSYNPATLFDNSGKFIAADRNNPREENQVVIHQSQSGVKFQRNSSSSDPRFAQTALSFHIMDKPPKTAQPQAPTPKHEGGKFNLPFLPNCERPGSRKTTVAQQIKNGGFDLVFYSPADQTQVAAAQGWEGKSVPYNGGKAVEYKDPEARWQMLALTARIRCLPSRFHFFESNGQRYLEYREGETAWVK